MSGASKLLRVAVVGVSTLIGEAVLAELRARKTPIAELHALDDERNIGRPVSAEEDAPTSAALPVGDVAAFDFSRVDLVFFCGRSALSERFAEAAAAHAWVVDGSAAFRMRADVPLVAADVNPGALDAVGARGLIALPGSVSVALATTLAPLHALAGLERVDSPARGGGHPVRLPARTEQHREDVCDARPRGAGDEARSAKGASAAAARRTD